MVQLAPLARRAAAALRTADDGLNAELQALREDWFGSDARSAKGKPTAWLARPTGPAGAAEASNAEIRDELWDFWGTMIYEPACRILHVADALDFVDEGALHAGVEARTVPEFGHHAASPDVVIAAMVMRTLLTLTAVGPPILQSFPPGADDPEIADEVLFFGQIAPLVNVVASESLARWG